METRNDPEEKEYGEFYKKNSKKEKLILSYADNFRRQYRQLYGDRKALFLTPVNEHGIEKFICTTLKPTKLPYKELYDYDLAGEFVADYLTYEVLEKPNKLPEKLVSPTLVLRQQKGNSFDHSVLLCSLLLGVGYDAYCVCGYATREVCMMDQTRNICPALEDKVESEDTKKDNTPNKYAVRPPKNFSSNFIAKMQARKEAEQKAEEERQHQEELQRIAEADKPPADQYYGLRVHCWVLVLAGKREVAQNFFIEPSTGETHSLDWDQYLGIESLWNHKNYWVNMQDCAAGVKGLSYDLGDAIKWEFFFLNIEKPLLVVPPDDEPQLAEDEDEDNSIEEKDEIDLPPSWVDPLIITPKAFATRCPRGVKTVLYKKAKLEKFAEYLNQDGMTSRLTIYSDMALSNPLEVRETFSYREDKLTLRVTNSRNGQVHEQFSPGRSNHLKEHIYNSNISSEATRIMTFYSHARVDGLVRREQNSHEMKEAFKGRVDFLCLRHVFYSKRVKKFEPAEVGNKKTIMKIVEEFERDQSKPATKDVAQRSFLLSESRIELVYHLSPEHITQNTREFVIPQLSADQGFNLTWSPDMTSAYHADLHEAEPKDRELFTLLEELVKIQEQSQAIVRTSEQEVVNILESRNTEEAKPTLSISVYNVERNEKARKYRQEQEQRAAEEERLRKEKEMDYLAPFLARLGDPPTLTKDQAQRVHDDCLQDLKSRLIDVANIIQTRYEQETTALQKRQTEYQQHQSSVSKQDEEEYIDYCKEAMFRIHILGRRLENHKSQAPKRYHGLEVRLKHDPRMTVLYQ